MKNFVFLFWQEWTEGRGVVWICEHQRLLGHTSACFPAEGTKTIIPGLQAIYQNLTGSMSSWNIHLG